MHAIGESVDRFVIEAVLGEGGMGRVYRALDPRLGRRVALKVLVARDGHAIDAEGVARMMREARAAAAFNHPNVVTIYEVGDSESGPYIAMELVSGVVLRAHVGQTGVTDATKLSWLTDVARGLAAAHRAGLVHRDIKPDNVMITNDGVVKILDFGIARGAENPSSDADGQAPTAAANLPSLTAEGQIVGTVHYMAPEQLRGEPLDGRCDQFAWGVLAWELFAGRLPWGNPSNSALLVTAILSTPARPLCDVAPGVSSVVGDLVAKALSKNRETRFATTDALLDALVGAASRVSAERAIALGATVPLPVAEGKAPIERRAGRRWVAVAAGVLAVGVAVGAATWRSFQGKRARDATSLPSVPFVPAVAGAGNAGETARPSLASVTASAAIAEDDRLEKRVASALKLSLGLEGTASNLPPPDPASASVMAVRGTGIVLRIEPEPDMVGASLVVMKDSFTDLSIALKGKPDPASGPLFEAGVAHLRSLLDLKTQLRTLSLAALEAGVVVQLGELRDLRYVANMAESRERGGLGPADEELAEVVAILGRQRRGRTMAASMLAMLVAYERAIGSRGDPKTLDDLAKGMLESLAQPGSSSLEEARAYVLGASQAIAQKGKYESWFRSTYGDDNFEKRYRGRFDAVFRRVGPGGSTLGDAARSGDDAASSWAGDGPVRDSLEGTRAIAHGDAKAAYAAAVRLAPRGGTARERLEVLARRIAF